MLVDRQKDTGREKFKILQGPSKGDGLVQFVQLSFIFVAVRLVMLVSGLKFFNIPILDGLLGSLIAALRKYTE